MVTDAINKQAFEFSCKTEEVAKKLQREIEYNTSVQINQIISSVLLELAGPETHLKIDKLEIDLGDITLAGFGKPDMLFEFKELFRQKIKDLKHHHGSEDRVERSSRSMDDFELIRSLLLHGDLPWWADKNTDIPIDEILQKAIRSSPRSLVDFLEEHGEKPGVLMRIVEQCKPSTRTMLEELVPGFKAYKIEKLFSGYEERLHLASLSQERLIQLRSILKSHKHASIEELRNLLFGRLITGDNLERLKSRFPAVGFAGVGSLYLSNSGVPGSTKNTQRKTRERLRLLIKKFSVFEIEFLLAQVTSLPSTIAGDDLLSENPAVEYSSQMSSSAREGMTYANISAEPADFITGKNKFIPDGDNLKNGYGDNGSLQSAPLEDVSFANATWGNVLRENASPENASLENGSLENASAAHSRVADNIPTGSSANSPALKFDTAADPSTPAKIPNTEYDTLSNSDHGLYLGADSEFDQGEKLEDNKKYEEKAAHFLEDNASNEPALTAGELAKTQAGHQQHDRSTSTSSDMEVLKLAEANSAASPADRNQPFQKEPSLESEPGASYLIKPDSIDLQKGKDSQSPNILQTGSQAMAAGNLDPENKEVIDGETKNASYDLTGTHAGESPQPAADRQGDSEPNRSRGAYENARIRKINFIMKKLQVAEPELFHYLGNLPEEELARLVEIFKNHIRENRERRKMINQILDHPYLLKYDILNIFTSLSFDDKKEPPATNSDPSGKQQRKQKENILSAYAKKIHVSQSDFLSFINKLSLKELVILKDVFAKNRFDSTEEKRIVRKILSRLPSEAILLIKYLTALSEEEIGQLFSSAEKTTSTNNLPASKKPAVFHDNGGVEKIMVENAGLCLVANYLTGFFKRLGYLENKQFKNKVFANRALYVLQYMVTGRARSPEYLLQLNKLLCGFDVQDSIIGNMRITKKEISEADDLLNAVIENWKTLKNTSLEGFRESFLQRKGILSEKESSWTLQVEKKGFDLLLNSIPWGYGFIKLPWMKKHILVEW